VHLAMLLNDSDYPAVDLGGIRSLVAADLFVNYQVNSLTDLYQDCRR